MYKIRESVKYVRASEGKLRDFRRCIQIVHLSDVGGGFLRLDVSTRWNARYMMLESAIKYHRAFVNLNYEDRNYKFCPSNEEWDRVAKMCDFLALSYHITNLISRSCYPSSSLYFMQVAIIDMQLNANLTSEDDVIKDMASRMKGKFDKYWKEYYVILALGSVLDPTSKLKFLSFCFKKHYPNDYQDKVEWVKDGLHSLFGEYANNEVASNSSLASSSREGGSHSLSSQTFNSSIIEKWKQERR